MDETLTNQVISQKVTFPNGNQARLVTTQLSAKVENIISALQIKPPKTVILVIGGADLLDENLESQLTELITLGVVQLAQKLDALIIDGGTHSGIMKIIGKSVAMTGYQSQLLGVAPTDKVTYPGRSTTTMPSDTNTSPLDHNHSHFVLIEGEKWGDETEMLYRLAKEFSQSNRVISILVSGGAITRKECLRSARFGWPIIAIEGSGRFADELIKTQVKQTHGDDAIIESIGRNGEIYHFPISGSPIDLEELISGLFREETTIKLAWDRFLSYDINSLRYQRSFRRFFVSILGINVIGTILVLMQTVLKLQNLSSPAWIDQILRVIAMAIPITSSVLFVAANRFNLSRKWIYLRSGAEEIKSHIFRYRTRAGIYSRISNLDKNTTPEVKLARNLQKINRRLSQTQANLAVLRPHHSQISPKMDDTSASIDNGINRLTSEQYVEIRIGDQINYFVKKTTSLEKLMSLCQWMVYILGGIGAMLAMLGFELWLSLTAILTILFANRQHS